uniref:Uncharacterized protein n=1 Tax=Ciona intestinalis TaxID=7719 RepID=H2XWG2_CIOIN
MIVLNQPHIQELSSNLQEQQQEYLIRTPVKQEQKNVQPCILEEAKQTLDIVACLLRGAVITCVVLDVISTSNNILIINGTTVLTTCFYVIICQILTKLQPS